MRWKHEQDEILRAHWGKLFAHEIADKIGTTRCAVIGRANRIKLKKLEKDHLWEHGSRKRLAPRPSRLKKKEPPREFVTPLRDALCTFDQLDSLKCHYPTWTGDPPLSDKFYCGMPITGEGSYCEFHRQICYTPPRSREDSAPRRPFIFRAA